jgi:hypothetical protein
MSLKSLLLRFALFYVGLMLVIGTVFALLGVKSSTAGNTGALIGAVMGACMAFTRANQRNFLPHEKRKAVLGMVAIDLALQTLVAAVLLAPVGGGIGSSAMLFGVLFVGALHAAVIWFFSGWAGNQVAKDLARAAAKR